MRLLSPLRPMPAKALPFAVSLLAGAAALGSAVALSGPAGAQQQKVAPAISSSERARRVEQAEERAEEKAEKQSARPANPKQPRSQRWQVSWAVDAGARKMSRTPVRTTVARLLTFKRPRDLPGTGDIPARYRTQRIRGVETTIWSVRGTVVNMAHERDGDYRLILSDGKGAQLTCVFSDPDRAPRRGRFSARIDAGRRTVERLLHPTLTPAT